MRPLGVQEDLGYLSAGEGGWVRASVGGHFLHRQAKLCVLHDDSGPPFPMIKTTKDIPSRLAGRSGSRMGRPYRR